MKICVVSLFPEMIHGFAQYGIPRIAIEAGHLELEAVNPRDFTADPHRTVDDRPFGGGPGMVMKAEPLHAALESARLHLQGHYEGERAVESGDRQLDRTNQCKTLFLSPQGRTYNQAMARDFAESGEPLILLAGRYEGVDERLIEAEVDIELSLGDYVLSGGEVAAMTVIDSIARLLPGVLGSEQSAAQDSFGQDGLLDHPHYTRPAKLPDSLGGREVPSVLLSGDHQKIKRWRRQQALRRTWLRRPELLDGVSLTIAEQGQLEKLKAEGLKANPDFQ